MYPTNTQRCALGVMTDHGSAPRHRKASTIPTCGWLPHEASAVTITTNTLAIHRLPIGNGQRAAPRYRSDGSDCSDHNGVPAVAIRSTRISCNINGRLWQTRRSSRSRSRRVSPAGTLPGDDRLDGRVARALVVSPHPRFRFSQRAKPLRHLHPRQQHHLKHTLAWHRLAPTQ